LNETFAGKHLTDPIPEIKVRRADWMCGSSSGGILTDENCFSFGRTG
jgi:hypothetical protein